MSSRMHSAAARAHANSVSSSDVAISARTTRISVERLLGEVGSNSPENTEEISEKPNGRQLVRACNQTLNLKQDSFATDAGCASSDFSNALNEKQRLDLQWVMNQSREYQALFIQGWEDALHMTPQQRKRTAMRCYLNRVFDFLKEESA